MLVTVRDGEELVSTGAGAAGSLFTLASVQATSAVVSREHQTTKLDLRLCIYIFSRRVSPPL